MTPEQEKALAVKLESQPDYPVTPGRPDTPFDEFPPELPSLARAAHDARQAQQQKEALERETNVAAHRAYMTDWLTQGLQSLAPFWVSEVEKATGQPLAEGFRSCWVDVDGEIVEQLCLEVEGIVLTPAINDHARYGELGLVRLCLVCGHSFVAGFGNIAGLGVLLDSATPEHYNCTHRVRPAAPQLTTRERLYKALADFVQDQTADCVRET